jgi:hypothetical protein
MPVSTDQMPTLFLKHRGTFELAKLVRTIQQWFTDNNYKFHAPKYKYKANEAELELYGEREITEYAQFRILLHLWARELTDVEVVQDGEKKKMQHAFVNLYMNGEIRFDYTKRFGGNKFFQWLQDFYHEYVIMRTITDVWEDDLLLKMNQLMAAIKDAFKMEVS